MKVTFEFSLTDTIISICALLDKALSVKVLQDKQQKARNVLVYWNWNLFFLHMCIIDSSSSRILTLGTVMFVASPSPNSVAGLGNQIVRKQPKSLGIRSGCTAGIHQYRLFWCFLCVIFKQEYFHSLLNNDLSILSDFPH